MKNIALLAALTLLPSFTEAQTAGPTPEPAPAAAPAEKPKKHWYETISLRGYTQIRYNNIAESDSNLQCQQCDRSLGTSGGVFLRRGRLVISGDVADNVYVYIQPDFGSSVSNTSLNFLQLRDAYFDVALTPGKEHRIRVGQSKVPYGFENLQSSQNRLTLDRNDALNSGVANERDMGAFYYWAPAEIRKRFTELVSSGLKGSGDYGVVGLGGYNGQTANRPDSNRNLHAVARASYPFKLGNGQFIEPGIQGYTGRYVVASDQRTAGLILPSPEIGDHRVAASLVVYPQPWGFQAEGTYGEGPEFDAPSLQTKRKILRGGYVQTMYMVKLKNGHVLIPFLKGQYYKGGKKHETDARSYLVREAEGGVEWQINKALELTALYAYADRRYEDLATRGTRHIGGRVRLQMQVNY